MSKLTTAARKRMPAGDFAMGKKKGTKGRYPINDAAHARNALSRVAQNGTPAEKAKVRGAVKRKFPGIKQSKPARTPSGKRYNITRPYA